MNNEFEKQLWDSSYVHIPLKADPSRTMESRALTKKILHSVDVWDGKETACWAFEGDGENCLTSEGGMKLKTWGRADHWPASEVRAEDASAGDYATFGSYVATLKMSGLDLAKCNRICFDLYCDCPGQYSPIVRVGFVNNGKVKIPDQYSREGFHAMNLVNHAWNHMTWEIESIPHDAVEELSFNMHRYGEELGGGKELVYEIRNIRFEEVEAPNVVYGWQCMAETAVFSTTGYASIGVKTAIANTKESVFKIVDARTNETAYKGQIRHLSTGGNNFAVLDFTVLAQDGAYKISFGNYLSEEFWVSETIFENAAWRLLNFLFCERCGCPVPHKHGTCHQDVYAEHQGVKLSFAGGWHDAADVSQQTIQTAEIAHAVLELAETVKDKNQALYLRLQEEAMWGIDFVLRMRFGDGHRATNSGIRRWTDNLMGNMDDCRVHVHNHSFENFICAGVQAFASKCFAASDRELAYKCLEAAKQDYVFAIERFETVGLEEIVKQEHASSASLSQYYAAAAWAAAQIFALDKSPQWQEYAVAYADKLMQCQEIGGNNVPMQGFFYRDDKQEQIVHFSHQSREQIFVQSLVEMCQVFPNNENKKRWEKAAERYGQYLKDLRQYTQPYGMLPAGIYHTSEAEDSKTFACIHPNVVHSHEKENYMAQVQNGIALGQGYYIKNFPVWFSFRGNSAIHLAMGKAASALGKYFKNGELYTIAQEQLYWTLGKNPMGQSLIYGEGSNFGQQYAAFLGETVGEMPVGIQTKGNEDLPYWPPANIATYREVWTTPAGRWLWILADVY